MWPLPLPFLALCGLLVPLVQSKGPEDSTLFLSTHLYAKHPPVPFPYAVDEVKATFTHKVVDCADCAAQQPLAGLEGAVCFLPSDTLPNPLSSLFTQDADQTMRRATPFGSCYKGTSAVVYLRKTYTPKRVAAKDPTFVDTFFVPVPRTVDALQGKYDMVSRLRKSWRSNPFLRGLTLSEPVGRVVSPQRLIDENAKQKMVNGLLPSPAQVMQWANTTFSRGPSSHKQERAFRTAARIHRASTSALFELLMTGADADVYHAHIDLFVPPSAFDRETTTDRLITRLLDPFHLGNVTMHKRYASDIRLSSTLQQEVHQLHRIQLPLQLKDHAHLAAARWRPVLDTLKAEMTVIKPRLDLFAAYHQALYISLQQASLRLYAEGIAHLSDMVVKTMLRDPLDVLTRSDLYQITLMTQLPEEAYWDQYCQPFQHTDCLQRALSVKKEQKYLVDVLYQFDAFYAIVFKRAGRGRHMANLLAAQGGLTTTSIEAIQDAQAFRHNLVHDLSLLVLPTDQSEKARLFYHEWTDAVKAKAKQSLMKAKLKSSALAFGATVALTAGPPILAAYLEGRRARQRHERMQGQPPRDPRQHEDHPLERGGGRHRRGNDAFASTDKKVLFRRLNDDVNCCWCQDPLINNQSIAVPECGPSHALHVECAEEYFGQNGNICPLCCAQATLEDP